MFIGNIIAFTGMNVPSGYLVCDGSEVGRDVYPELFATIGTTYGAGDGSTTFNIPNLSGKVAMGVSQSHPIASIGGEETHSLSEYETPSHYHNIPEHTHDNTITATTPALSHTITTQPSFTYTRLNATSSTLDSNDLNCYNGRTSKAMTLSTALAISNHPATACTVSGGITDCPAFDTESTGSGNAHNNMMPYMAVTYIIKSGTPVPIEPGMLMYNGCCVVTAGGGYITGKTA